jgi:hypothetical protein
VCQSLGRQPKLENKMTNIDLKIHYQSIPDVVFTQKPGMKKHLQSEGDIWAKFLKTIAENSRFETVAVQQGKLHVNRFSEIFSSLSSKIDDPAAFNNETTRHGNKICAPPIAGSLTGQLILGLFENEHLQAAHSAYWWFAHQNLKFNLKSDAVLASHIKLGEDLVSAAFVAEALPFHRVSSQKIAGASREAEGHAASLLSEVKKSSKTINEHEDSLEKVQKLFEDHFRSLGDHSEKLEDLRTERFDLWMRNNDAGVESQFKKGETRLAALAEEGETRLAALESASKKRQEEQNSEYERLRDLFFTQLSFRAPVLLWKKRSSAHATASKSAIFRFYLTIILAIGIGAFVPFFAGDYIASSFFEKICSSSDPTVCERIFSAKGPLTITGLLLVMSLVLWITRLQYRVYLSERHLSLDASEKQAFAETYLAMREESGIAADSEAIILSSLFRPTQDGIIKDDESSVDLSAAAIIAKQLGRGPH